jgi:hypothetical protein
MITTEERIIFNMLSAKIGQVPKKEVKISARELRLEKLKMRAIVDANPANLGRRKKI